MSQTITPLDHLKQNNFRLTRARRMLLEILSQDHGPHSVVYLLQALGERGVKVNKTTVYRELAFLQSERLVRPIQLLDRGARYELMTNDHHHHLVCVYCGEIDDVFFEQDLHVQEKQITAEKKFEVYNHSLEFYGCCQKCSEKNEKSLKNVSEKNA